MPQRRVLFLDAAHLSAFRVDGGSVVAEGDFAADAAGFKSFAAYLMQHRHSLFMLLADVAEEGFHLEDVPYSSGKDRIAIIKRKLAQHFYGTSLAVARTLGRLKTGRRDVRLLLMALTQPQQFDPWLTVLRGTQANLVGVYTIAQLVPALLPATVPAQLLVITQTRSGLRQTFFVDRQLHFSRLSPLTTGSAQESAIAVATESDKMHQYLSSQRLIDRSIPLTTLVLAHPTQLSALREHCHDSAQLRFEFISLPQEEKRAGLAASCTDSKAESLFCHLLAKKAPPEQFARSIERRYYRLWQTRFALQAAGAAVLAGGLLFTARLGIDIHGIRGTTEQIRLQTHLDQQNYDLTMRALPKIPLTADNLRALIARYDDVAKRAAGPAPLLAQLSQSLDVFQGIALEQVEWQIVERIGTGPASPPATARQLPVPPDMADGPYAQATVAARLPIGMLGDQRGQLELVADFTKHLGDTPKTLVTVLQPPVDTQSGKTLKSSDEKGTPEAPRFSFRLIRKL